MAQQPLPPGATIAPQAPLANLQPVGGGGGGLAPQGGPGGPLPLPAPVNHRTFAALYADENKDPLRTRYVAVMQRCDAEDPQAQAGDGLLQSVLDNSNIPNAFLCCSALHAGSPARIYLVHALSRYPQAPDGTVTPWDARIFGYLGDLLQEAATIVALPTTIFNIINNGGVRVYSEEVLAPQLAQLQADALFPRLNANAANSVNVRTRFLIRIPLRYASLLLSPKGYTPREAYVLLSEALALENVPEISNPIINWLRVALHATHQNNQGPPANAIAMVAPFLDEDLIGHRQPIINALLPNRLSPSQGLEAALTQFATAVTTQTLEDRNMRLAREIERDAPTTPANKFGLLLESLLNLLNVQEEAQLPEFWFQFSAAKKKQEFSIMRECLESYARSAQAFISMAPIATPKLHSDIATVTFVADHYDDLKTGIQPFMVMDGSEEYRASALELSRSFGLLFEREMGVSFNDLAQFKVPKELRSFPLNYRELEQNLGIFGNLIGTILGENHPITRNFRVFWNALMKQYRQRLRQHIDGPRSSIKPVNILRNVQLICHDWFEAKKALGDPETPNFTNILRSISLGAYVSPQLPLHLYQLVHPRPNPNPTPTLLLGSGPPSLAGTGTRTATITTSDDASLANHSVVSGLTGATGLTTAQKSTLVVNENPDPNLLTLIPFNRRIKDLIGTTQPPNTDSGTPMCLSFHVKGGCYSNCRRKANHAHPLNAAEKERLANYVADRLEKLSKP